LTLLLLSLGKLINCYDYSNRLIDIFSLNLNLKPLRILRVLRPLRSIKAIPSMRSLVGTLLVSIPELLNAGFFILFLIILFSIFGLQQFEGLLHYRCRLTEKPVNSTFWPISNIHVRVCSPSNKGDNNCPSDMWCGSPIQYGISLKDDGVFNDPIPFYGINTFDNIGSAILSVFQTITAENWTSMMYTFSDANEPIFAKLYFCAIIIVGHYYTLNLLLAVIMQNLSKI
jgi:Ion transport protein